MGPVLDPWARPDVLPASLYDTWERRLEAKQSMACLSISCRTDTHLPGLGPLLSRARLWMLVAC